MSLLRQWILVFFFRLFLFSFLFQILWLVAVKLSHLFQCFGLSVIFSKQETICTFFDDEKLLFCLEISTACFFLAYHSRYIYLYIIFIIAKCHVYFSVFALLRYKLFLIWFVRSFFSIFFRFALSRWRSILYKLLKSTISDFSKNYAFIALGTDDQWFDP